MRSPSASLDGDRQRLTLPNDDDEALAERHARVDHVSMTPPLAVPSVTPKQGQYLAFIYAYTRVLGRPPAEADLQRHFGLAHRRSIKWCSP